jgi:hypothetical protein
VKDDKAMTLAGGRADKFTWIVVGLLSLLLFVALLQNLSALSLWMDEGFHYLAVKGILDHGAPIFPSGHMYWKAILYTYLLSGLAAVFGLNAFSLRVLSVLAAAGSLPLLYLLGKKLFNRWVGLAAAVLLALSPWLAEDGRAALYFAPVLFFCLLGVILFTKGFFEEHRRSKVTAVIVLMLTPLIHQLGMCLWFCFLGLLLVRGLKRFLKKDVMAGLILVTGFYGLIQLQEFFFWKVGYVYVKTDSSLRGMIDYFFSSFSLAYFKEFTRSFPAMSLTVAAGFLVCMMTWLVLGRKKAWADRFRLANWAFLNFCLIFPLLFLGFFRTHIQPRYLFELYGVFLLLFAASAFHLGQGIADLVLLPLARGLRAKARAATTLVLFAGLLIGLAQNIGWGRVSAIIQRHYGDPIATDIIYRSGRPAQEDHENTGLYVRHFLRPDDIVIAIHVVFGSIYAGRADYWLWTGGPGTWDAWEQTPTGWRDFYVGARWINNLPDLRKVIEDNPRRRVWLIASNSLLRRDHITTEIRDFVKSQPDKLVFRGKDGQAEVYLWNEDPPRLTSGRHTLEAEWLPVRKARVVYRDDLSKEAGLLFKKGRRQDEAFSYKFEPVFPAGRYRMTWRAAVTESGSSNAAAILNLVTDKGAKLRSLTLRPDLFKAAGTFEEFSVDFYLPGESRLVLKGAFSGTADLWVDTCDLTRLPEDP